MNSSSDKPTSNQPDGLGVVNSWADEPILGQLAGAEFAGTVPAGTETCQRLQLDISCHIDGELTDAEAARVVEHLDLCSSCSASFDELRAQLSANRDLNEPEALVARYAEWAGVDLGLESIELVTRLSNIFYKLGKAYVLASKKGGARQRVFERAVEMDATQTSGRGFIDGVVASGRDSIGGVDWRGARRMLNGQLAKIESPAAKGRALLNEALNADSTHEEARLYLAFLDIQEGRTIRAAADLRELLDVAIDKANRGHAANQLGLLLASQREYRRAVACFRWVIASGLADEDDRFFVARFNVGIYYAHLKNQKRSLEAFRALLDRHPGRITEVADLFFKSASTRRVMESQPGFVEALCATCPELFGLDGGGDSRVQEMSS